MSRPIYTRIFVVRLKMSAFVAYIRAFDVVCDDKFTHFTDGAKRTVHSLHTDLIVDIATREFTVHELNEIFPARVNYVEVRAVKSGAAPSKPQMATVHKLHR